MPSDQYQVTVLSHSNSVKGVLSFSFHKWGEWSLRCCESCPGPFDGMATETRGFKLGSSGLKTHHPLHASELPSNKRRQSSKQAFSSGKPRFWHHTTAHVNGSLDLCSAQPVRPVVAVYALLSRLLFHLYHMGPASLPQVTPKWKWKSKEITDFHLNER